MISNEVIQHVRNALARGEIGACLPGSALLREKSGTPF